MAQNNAKNVYSNRQKIVPIRGVCHLHKARRPHSVQIGFVWVAYFPSLFSLQVSFKGNYPELDDMSKTVVGKYSYSSQFENESYKRLYNEQINACLVNQVSFIHRL